MKEKINLKDLNIIYVFTSIMFVVGFLQFSFFSNLDNNFDPNVFIYIYLVFGAVIFITFRKKINFNFTQVIYFSLYSKLAIIIIQILVYLISNTFNESNEVEYYEILSKVLLGEYSFKYGEIRNGIPPGYQAWILLNYFGYMKTFDPFWKLIVFSAINMAIDTLVLLFVQKLGRSKDLLKYNHNKEGNGEESNQNLNLGILIYSISIFNIYYFNLRNFMDPIAILLGIIGIYCYYEGKFVFSSIFLSLSAIIKILSIFWILIIVLQLLKDKKVKQLFGFIFTAASIILISFYIAAAFAGVHFLNYLLEFFPLMREWSEIAGKGIQLNQVYTFYLSTDIYYILILGSVTAVAIIMVFFGKNQKSLHIFSAVLAIYIILQPWYDQRYFLWILPLLCVDLIRSRNKFRIIFLLMYVSILIYIFCLHFVYEFDINTFLDDDPRFVGLFYRIFGQSLSFIAFIYIIQIEFQYQFRFRKIIPEIN